MKRQRCGPGKKIVSAVIPVETYNILHARARSESISVSAYCARVVTDHCRKNSRLTVYEIPTSHGRVVEPPSEPAKAAESPGDYDPSGLPIAPVCPLVRPAPTNRGNGEGVPV